MTVTESEAFKKAQKDLVGLGDYANASDGPRLYGLYKVATGRDFKEAPKPRMLDFVGKFKHEAWGKVIDEGITTPEVAQEKYVALVEEIKKRDPKARPEEPLNHQQQVVLGLK